MTDKCNTAALTMTKLAQDTTCARTTGVDAISCVSSAYRW